MNAKEQAEKIVEKLLSDYFYDDCGMEPDAIDFIAEALAEKDKEIARMAAYIEKRLNHPELDMRDEGWSIIYDYEMISRLLPPDEKKEEPHV